MPKVSIILLNWNGWGDTIECLESVFNIDYPNFEVLVADNNSTNGSVQKIKDWAIGKLEANSNFLKLKLIQKPISYLETSEDEILTNKFIAKKKVFDSNSSLCKFIIINNNSNCGFARGNNIATELVLKENKSDYILLLNNDTVVAPNFLTILIGELNGKDNVAITGPKMYYYDYDKKNNVIWFGGGKINWKKYAGYHQIDIAKEDIDHVKELSVSSDWISGACILINLRKINPLLNEDYFFGCEDIDMCIKTKKKGYDVLYVPQSTIWHKVSKSRKKTMFQNFKSDLTNFKLIKNNYVWWPVVVPFFCFQIVINVLNKKIIYLSKFFHLM